MKNGQEAKDLVTLERHFSSQPYFIPRFDWILFFFGVPLENRPFNLIKPIRGWILQSFGNARHCSVDGRWPVEIRNASGSSLRAEGWMMWLDKISPHSHIAVKSCWLLTCFTLFGCKEIVFRVGGVQNIIFKFHADFI